MPLLKKLVENEEIHEVPSNYVSMYISGFKRFAEPKVGFKGHKRRAEPVENLKMSLTTWAKPFQHGLNKSSLAEKLRAHDNRESLDIENKAELDSSIKRFMKLQDLFRRAVASEYGWRITNLNTFSPFDEILFSKGPVPLHVIWDEDVKDHLKEDSPMDIVLKKTVDDIIRYAERVEGLIAVRIRFLKDPDDSTKAIMLEIQHDSSLSKPEIREHKKWMRSKLTENAKRLTSSRQQYIRIRAASNVVTRGV